MGKLFSGSKEFTHNLIGNAVDSEWTTLIPERVFHIRAKKVELDSTL